MDEEKSIPTQGREVPNQVAGDCRSDAEEAERAKELDNLLEEMERALEESSKGILTQEEIDELLKTAKSRCGETTTPIHPKEQSQDEPRK